MRFIVDTMLGRLAKWLRVLGYDTLYNPQYSDDDLFFKAHLEKRVLLTRDRELATRMNPAFCLYITHQVVREQIKQVIIKFNLDTTDHIFTRCTLCNSIVQPVEKSEIREFVPEYIYSTINNFVKCNKCQKIYWPGSHIKNVMQILEEINETISKRNR